MSCADRSIPIERSVFVVVSVLWISGSCTCSPAPHPYAGSKPDSGSEITDIDSSYIGSVIDLDALTKISRQLNVSMGSMMGLVNGFAIAIYITHLFQKCQGFQLSQMTMCTKAR